MYRADAARDGHAEGSALNAELARRLKLAWTAHLDGAIDGTAIESVSQHRRVVVAATEAGEIAALDENKGTVLWKRTGLGMFSGSPAALGGYVVAATLTGHAYKLDVDTGRTYWDWTAPGTRPAIWSSPIIVDSPVGLLVVLGVASQYGDNPLEPGRVVALHMSAGRPVWSFCIEVDCAPGGGVWSSVAVDTSGRAFVGTGNPDDGVISFAAATGQRGWATSLNRDSGRDVDVGATPVVLTVAGREVVAVGSNAGVFAELDASTGAVVWSRELVSGSAVHGLIASPAYDGRNLYVGSASPPTGMFALDPATGKTLWQQRTGLPVYSAPAVGNAVVIFGIGDVFGDPHQGGLVALSTADGAVLWSYDAHSSVFSAPAIVFNIVIVGDSRGDVLAFAAGQSG